ncbi:MAG TPA: methyltransferase domain-containing protein [Aliidongia sp.]|nr:methyltransferase domain-containing protein [Aliidongia sp.]
MVGSDTQHAEQVAYWNGPGGAHWAAQQARTDAGLAEVAAVAIDRARVRPGETVLDIGCGSGATTAGLAEAVGPAGRVIALDVSGPMLAAASRRLAGLGNVDFVLADAASYRFPEGVADLLFSRFGVMFFGEPAEAFANMRRALKPDGRVSFACWRPIAENPWVSVTLEAVYEHVARPPRPDPESPGGFSFGDPDRVRRILTDAGFAEPSFEPVDFVFDLALGGGLEAAVDQVVEIGPASRLLDGQPPELLAAAKESLRRVLAPYEQDGRVALPSAIWIVQATL